MKYIRHRTEDFILFTEDADLIWHSEVARRLFGGRSDIISAGFVEWRDGKPHCYGESSSLGIESREGDSEALCKMMGIPVEPPKREKT